MIIATKNKGKVREIKHVLKSLKLRVLSLLDLPKNPGIKENGRTFQDNAVKKASIIAGKLGALTLADDSGLQVRSLNGRPGIRSARYAGPNPTSKKLCIKLLREMKKNKDRSARFVCAVAICGPGKRLKIIQGICKGMIIDRMLGSHGFGYDPVFMPEGYRKTFAQMPLKLKNKISHRGRALRKAKAYLARIIPS